MRLNIITYVALLFFWANTCRAESDISLYTPDVTGIPYSAVTSFAEDDDGNMWFGHSGDGVSFFNGETWSVYSVEDGLASGDVNDIASSDTDVWCATDKGVCHFDGNRWTTDLDGLRITGIQVDVDGMVWVSGIIGPGEYRNVISRFDGAAWTTWPLGVEKWVLDDTGNLWVVTFNGLYRYDGGRWDLYTEPWQQMRFDCAVDGSGTVWFAGGDAVSFDGAEWSVYDFIADYKIVAGENLVACRLSNSFYFNLLIDGGWYQYDLRDDFEAANPGKNSLSADWSMFIDSRDRLWLGGAISGVACVTPDPADYDEQLDVSRVLVFPHEAKAGYVGEEPPGDFADWFPMHIGDTWVYEREYVVRAHWDTPFRDILVNTIIDTVTVKNMLHYRFLDGTISRHDDDGNVYSRQSRVYSFDSADSLQYNQTWQDQQREIRTMSLDFQDVTGYDFYHDDGLHRSFSFIAPPLGKVYFGHFGDYDKEVKRLAYAIIDGVEYGISIAVEPDAPPSPFSLSAPYPNPFNASVSIELTMPEARHATVTVYNVLGQPVRTLHDGSFTAGTHRLRWDGVTSDGVAVSSGVYFFAAMAGKKHIVRRALLVR